MHSPALLWCSDTSCVSVFCCTCLSRLQSTRKCCLWLRLLWAFGSLSFTTWEPVSGHEGLPLLYMLSHPVGVLLGLSGVLMEGRGLPNLAWFGWQCGLFTVAICLAEGSVQQVMLT